MPMPMLTENHLFLGTTDTPEEIMSMLICTFCGLILGIILGQFVRFVLVPLKLYYIQDWWCGCGRCSVWRMGLRVEVVCTLIRFSGTRS